MEVSSHPSLLNSTYGMCMYTCPGIVHYFAVQRTCVCSTVHVIFNHFPDSILYCTSPLHVVKKVNIPIVLK